jgi:hypothetical protein
VIKAQSEVETVSRDMWKSTLSIVQPDRESEQKRKEKTPIVQ